MKDALLSCALLLGLGSLFVGAQCPALTALLPTAAAIVGDVARAVCLKSDSPAVCADRCAAEIRRREAGSGGAGGR